MPKKKLRTKRLGSSERIYYRSGKWFGRRIVYLDVDRREPFYRNRKGKKIFLRKGHKRYFLRKWK